MDQQVIIDALVQVARKRRLLATGPSLRLGEYAKQQLPTPNATPAAGGRAVAAGSQNEDQARRGHYEQATQTRTSVGVKQHGNLIRGLLSDVKRFRIRRRMKINGLARVDRNVVQNGEWTDLRR